MAKLVYGLNQSLDGYVDHLELRPSLALFRHFIEHVSELTGIVYGRRMYEVMRYWDEDHADWVAEEHNFATAWRSKQKWVVSRTLKSVGPNATLVEDDIEAVIRGLKAQPVPSIPPYLVAASHSSPAPGRRSALLPAIELART
jgi:dihydrofolate reductase